MTHQRSTVPYFAFLFWSLLLIGCANEGVNSAEPSEGRVANPTAIPLSDEIATCTDRVANLYTSLPPGLDFAEATRLFIERVAVAQEGNLNALGPEARQLLSEQSWTHEPNPDSASLLAILVQAENCFARLKLAF